MVKKNYSPSIADLLLATLCSGRSVKRFYSILHERSFEHRKKGSVQVTLSRLHKKGFVTYSRSGWSTTISGKNHIREISRFVYISSPFKKDSPDTTIISFDIPEPDRKIRNWLRNQIKIFGYKMLQQSLWIGPGPLPASFLKRLEELKIRKNIKIFSKIKKTT
jgi:phenylacetic acid degradation operon negative regulatory protein